MQSTLSTCILILSTPIMLGFSSNSKLTIDEYKLVKTSDYDPIHQRAVDLIHLRLKTVPENILRSWPEAKASVPHKSPGGTPESAYMGSIEVNGQRYTLHRIGKRYVIEHDWEGADYEVKCNGKTICKFTGHGYPTGSIVKAFFAWDDQWIVEHFHYVIIAGRDLNKELGYSKIFHYRIICGKPFFFFEKNGVIGINYDGHEQANFYDQVPHYGCCDPGAMNPQSGGCYVRFYAAKNGFWHYVEAGIEKNK